MVFANGVHCLAKRFYRIERYSFCVCIHSFVCSKACMSVGDSCGGSTGRSSLRTPSKHHDMNLTLSCSACRKEKKLSIVAECLMAIDSINAKPVNIVFLRNIFILLLIDVFFVCVCVCV